MDTKKSNRQILSIMGVFTLAAFVMFIVGGCMQDGIGAAVKGFAHVQLMPAQMTLDYFKHATVGGTFLNVGLVGLSCMAIFKLSGAALNGVSCMAFFLTIGFSFFGMNMVNIWPCIFGTLVFTMVAKVSFASEVNIAVMTTGAAPFISEVLFRYPVFGDNMALRIVVAILTGIFIGFVLPILCKSTASLHKGYTLYNAAAGICFIAIFLYALFFKAVGVEGPTNTDLGESLPLFVNLYAVGTGVICIIVGFIWNGCSFKGYGKVLSSTGYKTDYTKISPAMAIINIGIVELFMTAYYNMIGSSMTGPTLAAIICLLSTAASGTHVLNVIPVIIGYAIACTFCTFTLTTQAIILGLCYATAITPIAGTFGPIAGILAGLIHAVFVTQIVTTHNAFSFYNGGITCFFTAVLLANVLEYFFKPDEKFRWNPIPLRKEK